MAAGAAWITGGGRGIGLGIAKALARDGYTVWLTSRSEAECEAAATEIRALGGSAHGAPADVSDGAQVAAVCRRISSAGAPLAALVCSAGVGVYGALDVFDPAALDRMLAVNVRGTLHCAQAALPALRASGGALIGIASVMAVTGYRNQGAYAASKHAMLGLLKVLAKEEQVRGVRVSCVCPGGVDTAMVRASRPDLDPAQLMTVEDVAGAVRYLLALSPRCAVDVIHLRRRGAEPFAV